MTEQIYILVRGPQGQAVGDIAIGDRHLASSLLGLLNCRDTAIAPVGMAFALPGGKVTYKRLSYSEISGQYLLSEPTNGKKTRWVNPDQTLAIVAREAAIGPAAKWRPL